MKRFLLLMAFIFIGLSTFAHTWEIRVKQNQDGTLTWYGQSYHSVSECGFANSGIRINGVDYNWTASFSGSAPSTATVFTYSPSQSSRQSYATVTTPYIGGALSVVAYSTNACWALMSDMPPGNGSFNPPPPPVCTSCPLTGWTSTVNLPGNNNGTPCFGGDDITSATISVNHLACANITGDGKFSVVFDAGGTNVAYGPFNYSTGIQTNVTINVPAGTTTGTQVRVIDNDFPCDITHGLNAPYNGEKETVPPTLIGQNVTVQLDANGNASIVSGQSLSDIFLENFNSDPNTVVTTLTNWNFTQNGMTVDVGEYIANNGSKEIDLAGNSNAKIISKQSFSLVPGQYKLTFNNRLNNNPSGGNSVKVVIGNLVNQTFASQLTATNESITFTVVTPTTVNLEFEQLGTNDAAGSFIGNIRLSRVLNPSYSVFVSAADNCGVDGISVSKSTFYCSDLGLNTVVLSVTDINGNETQQNVTVLVQDIIKPTISCPSNQELNLDGSCSAVLPDYRSLVTSSDNCGSTITQSPAPGTLVTQKGAVIVTFTATDVSGNIATCNLTVDKKDVIPPSITCPINITVNNNMNACGAVVTYQSPTATDNCSGSAFNHFNPGEPNNAGTENHLQLYNNATWNDLNGNNNMVFIIEINSIYNSPIANYTLIGTHNGHTYFKSNFAATWANARNNALALGIGADLASINTLAESTFLAPHGGATWVGGYQDTGDPGYAEPGTAAQNFGGWKWVDGTKLGAGQITITQVAGLPSGAQFPIGTTVNTWRATDESGSFSECSFNVTVTDNQNPTITAPASLTVPMNAGSCFATSVNLGNPTFGDNCTGAVVTNNAPSQFAPGLTAVLWTVTDASGRTATALQNVTVVDNQNPTITCGSNITQNVDAGTCGAAITVANPTSADNCSVVEQTWTMTGATTASSPATGFNTVGPRVYNVGTTTITYIVKDKSGIGNSATCTQTITITDNVPPVITCPANISVNTDVNVCGAVVNFSAPTVSDNCAASSGGGVYTFTNASATGRTGPTQTMTNTSYASTNLHGTVTSTNGKQLWTVPTTGLYRIKAIGASGGQQASNEFGTGAAMQGEIQLTQGTVLEILVGQHGSNGTVWEGSGGGGGSFVVNKTTNQPIIIAAGGAGSSGNGIYANRLHPGGSSLTGNPNVQATSGPQLAGAGGGGYLLNGQNGYQSAGGASYVNGATGGLCQYGQGASHGGFGGGGGGSYYTSGGGGGGYQGGSVVSDYHNTSGPQIAYSYNAGINQVNASGITSTSSLEKKHGQVVIEQVAGSISIAQTSGLPSGSTFPVGTTTNTFVATDAAGNTSTCSFDVTVIDNQLPVITHNGNMNVQALPGLCNANPVVTATASDNCSVATPTGTRSDAQPLSAPFPVGTTTITWNVVDINNNAALPVTQTVTVVDNQKPVITNMPADIVKSANSSICGAVVTWMAPTVNDNCGIASVVCSDPDIASGLPVALLSVGVHTITYTVTDIHNNVSTASFKITITDDTNPIITGCPSNININTTAGLCTGVALWNPPTASDNCPGVIMTGSHISGQTFPVGTTKVTYTATDASGRTATCSFDVVVTDDQPPVVSNCPANITVQTGTGNTLCSKTATWTAPTATDNCGGVTVTSTHQPGATLAVGTTTVTYTFTDNHNNVTTCSFTVTVVDNTAPVPNIANLATITSECSASAPVPTATDNCGGVINGVPSGPTTFSTQGTHTITWTYTDAAGNASSQSQNIVIDDNTPPVIACPFNIQVNATPGTCGAVVTYNQPSATDNCGNGALPTSIPGYTYKGTFGGHTYFLSNTATTPENAHAQAIALGGHLVTINSAAENAFVSAMNPAFIWIGYTDRAVEGQFKWVTNEPVVYTNWNGGEPNNAGNEDWAVINWGPNGTWNDWTFSSAALYAVEFEGGNIPTTLVSGPASGSVFPVGTTTVTYSATDAGGNTVSCSFTVTVRDVEPPKITCPANINAIATSAAGAIVNYTAPVGTDNCSGANTVRIAGPASGSTFPIGTTTITYRVTDAAGLTTTCSFTVTVVGVPPVIVCPANIFVTNTTGACGTNVSFTATETTAIPASTITYSHQPGSFFPVGTTTVTATATNPVGTSVCTFTVTVNDNEKPVFSVIPTANITVDCDDVPAPVTLTAADNCAPSLPVSYFQLPNVSVNTLHHWTADGNMNDVAGSATGITTGNVSYSQGVLGSNAFAFNGNGYINVGTTGSVNGTGDFAVSAWIKTTSNAGMTVIQQRDANINGQYILKIGTNHNAGVSQPGKVYFLVAGAEGLGEVFSTISVNDGKWHHIMGERSGTTIKIYIDGTLNTTASTGGVVTMNTNNAIRTTIGADIRNIQFSMNPNYFNGSIDQVKVHSASACPQAYERDRYWSVIDPSGNQSVATQTMHVVDITAPVIIKPATNATVECDGAGNTSALNAWLASNGGASAVDACGTVTWSNNFASLSDACGNTGTAAVTFTATDDCGNASSTTATFTIIDETAPVITDVADVTVNCQDDTNPSATGSATATDICSGVTITHSDVSTKNSNANHKGHYNYTITRTWTATDACNNSSSSVQVITVQDVTPPVAICKPVTITLVNGTASITTDSINNNSTDNCSPMTYSLSKSTFNCSDLGANTVILTVTDVSGNSSTCTTTVTVVGEIPTCSIVSVPTSNVYTGGNVNNLYLGYGAQSTTLQLSVPASGAPYSYSWSGNGTLSSTTVQSPLFAPTAAGTYTFTVFITNKYGCTTTCKISICVTDIRVMSKSNTWDGKKVYVCHVPPGNPGNSNTLEISVNAVPSHIGPSGHATDRLGKCEVAPCTAPTYSKAPVNTEVKTAEALAVKLSPNPTTNYFMLQVISGDRKTPVTVRVMNALGKMIETQKGSVEDIYRFGNSYINGTYFVEVIQGESRKVVQGIKAN